jgi:hypothetical protein
VPLDYGCGLDQHHGVQASRPNPVEPHPEQPVGREQPKPTFVLAPQHTHLMPNGLELDVWPLALGGFWRAAGSMRLDGRSDVFKTAHCHQINALSTFKLRHRLVVPW